MHSRKTNINLQRELLPTVLSVDSSQYDKGLFRWERSPNKKQLLTFAMNQKRLLGVRNTRLNGIRLYSATKDFFFFFLLVQGRWSTKEHTGGTTSVKTVKSRCFTVIFTYGGPGILVPVEGMMNSKNYTSITTSVTLHFRKNSAVYTNIHWQYWYVSTRSCSMPYFSANKKIQIWIDLVMFHMLISSKICRKLWRGMW